MDRIVDDQDSLIESRNQANSQMQTKLLIKYIVSKLFPFFWIVFASIFISSPTIVYFFVFIFAIIDLWLCRRQFSYSLVGLTWNLDMPDPQLSFEDLVTFQIEPDPFVPSTRDSNIFWLLLSGTTAYYILLTIISLLRLRIGPFFFLLVISFLEAINLLLYLKCLNISKKQSEETVKSLMINTVHSEFLNAVPVVDDTEVTTDHKVQEEKHEDKNENDDKKSLEKEDTVNSNENNKDENTNEDIKSDTANDDQKENESN